MLLNLNYPLALSFFLIHNWKALSEEKTREMYRRIHSRLFLIGLKICEEILILTLLCLTYLIKS